MILACPLCGGRLKSGRGIPPKGIIFAGSMGRKFLCVNCKKEVLPVEFDNSEEYLEFIKELKKDDNKEAAEGI